MGAFHMISNKPSPPINLDLVDQVCKHIPAQGWPFVKDQLIDALVDAMPTHVLEKLTGDPMGDDRAIEILDDYYKPDERNQDLIIDSFKIIGEEQTIYLLDLLQLDKTNTNEQTPNT
jgi:hypothetical protein